MTGPQLQALLHASIRQLIWGLRTTSKELARWRRFAECIPDEPIRADALDVLDRKRTHAHGAALFWILPRRRNPALLRLLIAYELIWDLLDNLSERAVASGQLDGRTLHLAIAEAIDPQSPVSNYLAQHPWHNDAGYLNALVLACRESCLRLPGYELVRVHVVREAHRAQVLWVNHDPDPDRRATRLKGWALKQRVDERWAWWEISGAASAPLTIHALLSIAAEHDCTEACITRVQSAYLAVSAATTMLDSYVDQAEDIANGDHSYISHYPDTARMRQGINALIVQGLTEVLALPNGETHAIIAAAMVAMYLSKPSAHEIETRRATRQFIRAGGSLTRLLHPILRVWRIVYRQQTA